MTDAELERAARDPELWARMEQVRDADKLGPPAQPPPCPWWTTEAAWTLAWRMVETERVAPAVAAVLRDAARAGR